MSNQNDPLYQEPQLTTPPVLLGNTWTPGLSEVPDLGDGSLDPNLFAGHQDQQSGEKLDPTSLPVQPTFSVRPGTLRDLVSGWVIGAQTLVDQYDQLQVLIINAINDHIFGEDQLAPVQPPAPSDMPRGPNGMPPPNPSPDILEPTDLAIQVRQFLDTFLPDQAKAAKTVADTITSYGSVISMIMGVAEAYSRADVVATFRN